MSILQISKIQVRSGDLVDLPQLDEAEFGFANDSSRLFIGKTSPNENVEILTAYSSLAFSQITGANGANLSLSSFEEGQVLAISDNSGNVTITNRGATKGGTINLGSISNVKILGGSSSQVISTDGLGNLSFFDISSIVNLNPAGSNTQVQFNDSGSFGANTGFTFNKTTGLFSIPANISIAGNTLTTSSSDFSFANANATTIQFGGAATAMAIGASGSSVTFRGNVALDKSLTFTDANGSNSDTSVYYTSSGTEAIVVALNNSSRMQVENGQTVMYGNTVVHTGNLEFANVPSVLNLANANAGNINIGGAASNINVGATGSLTSFRGNISIDRSIRFTDANGTTTDTSIYYIGSGIDTLVLQLNGSSKIQVTNSTTVLTDDVEVQGNIDIDYNANVTGNVTSGSYFVRSTQVGVSAAGATQGTATALTKDINAVYTVSAGEGVRLPTAIPGMGIIVINTNANNLLVYPATGAYIDSNPINSPYTLLAGTQKQFVAPTTINWYTLG